jgi:hypothetical protein
MELGTILKDKLKNNLKNKLIKSEIELQVPSSILYTGYLYLLVKFKYICKYISNAFLTFD